MKIDSHVHSGENSGCARLTEAGYGGFVLTDHFGRHTADYTLL